MATELKRCVCHKEPMVRHKRNDTIKGYRWRCAVKMSDNRQKFKTTNPDYFSRWEKDNREKRNQRYSGKYHNRLYRYGLSEDEFYQMLGHQNYECSICSIYFAKDVKVCVDHDHTTGRVRALLCHHCNIGLGHFKDDVGILQEAISYLNNHQIKQELEL